MRLKAITNRRATRRTLNKITDVDETMVLTPNEANHQNNQRRNVGVWVVALLTLVSVSLLIKLGLWQRERGFEKQQLEQHLAMRATQPSKPLVTVLTDWEIWANSIESKALSITDQSNSAAGSEYLKMLNGTKVTVNFAEDNGLMFLLDNQTHQGSVGYILYQLMPVVGFSEPKYILVDLGFVKASKKRSELPVIELPLMPQQVSGRLYVRSTNPLSFDLALEETKPKRIQNLNIAAISDYTATDILPVLFQPIQDETWPYELLWRPTAMKSEKHFGYSVQWFAMAAVLSGLMLLLGYRFFSKRDKRENHDEK